MYRLKLFICNLSIRDNYGVKMIDLFAYHGFSATVYMFIRFSKGAIAVSLIIVGKCFKTQVLYNLWLSFNLPEYICSKRNSSLKKQGSFRKKNPCLSKNKTVFICCCLYQFTVSRIVHEFVFQNV